MPNNQVNASGRYYSSDTVFEPNGVTPQAPAPNGFSVPVLFDCSTSIFGPPCPSDIQLLITNMIRSNSPYGGGGGYNVMYSVFLPEGIDVCLDSYSGCYSPDNPSQQQFCGYHMSFDTYDAVGANMHVIYQVIPYQNVNGCSVTGGPNGSLIDSTNSTFSHEIFETITDPDGNAWQVDPNIFNTPPGYIIEIGDLCRFAPVVNPIYLHTNAYAIQPEFSNIWQDCEGSWSNRLATHDFDGNGYSDIAFLDQSGDWEVWLFGAGSETCQGCQYGVMQQSGVIQTTQAGVSWQMVGQSNFLGGNSSEVLWWNSNNYNVVIWGTDGNQLTQNDLVGTGAAGWNVIGKGDFNADGIDDILWRYTPTGQVGIWFMQSDGTVLSNPIVSAPGNNSWSVAGVADFDGDGNADILWLNYQTHEVSIWFMNGAQISWIGNVGTFSAGWYVAGTGDFDGDGKADILWESIQASSYGQVGIWLMNGATPTVQTVVGAAPGFIQTTGDFDGDVRSDILFQDASGNLGIWFMDGIQISWKNYVGTLVPGWTPQILGAD